MAVTKKKVKEQMADALRKGGHTSPTNAIGVLRVMAKVAPHYPESERPKVVILVADAVQEPERPFKRVEQGKNAGRIYLPQ